MKPSIFRQALCVSAAAVLTTVSHSLTTPTAHAQGGTPGLMEFRWDSDRNYRKLYYFQTSSVENDRSVWHEDPISRQKRCVFCCNSSCNG